jgi:DNA mismatch endonuclease (patch repair protein)
MSRIRSQGTKLEEQLEDILKSICVEYENHPNIFGKPDFAYSRLRIAIFADSDFWHGFNWDVKKKEIKTNKDFWKKKIERNMTRDADVTDKLEKQGWSVIRLWGHDILKNPNKCKKVIEKALRERIVEAS